MIREFISSDIEDIAHNAYSDKELFEKIRPVLGQYEASTVVRDGVIRAILFYRNYAETNYECFLIGSTFLSAYDSQEIREFIRGMMERRNIRRVETLSLNDDELNRWHKFLGFSIEGTKRRFLNGQDYNFWAILREG